MPKLAKLTLTAQAGQAGETCVALFENQSDGKPGQVPVAKRCTYGIVWAASASAQPNGQALALAVQPLGTWRELWLFHKTAGQWSITILPPASSSPALGYVEFAGWVPGGQQMLVARETRIAGRYKRSFEVLRIDTLNTEKQASDPSLLAAFRQWQAPSWKQQTVSVR